MRVLLIAMLMTALPAVAQKPDMKGGAVVASEPGRAAIVAAAELSAQVVSIEKKTRTLSLKGPKGNVQDVVVSNEVKNFNKIKVGDLVVVRYMQSLALELQPVKTGASGISVSEGAGKAEPGKRPAAGAVREIQAIAKVTAIDQNAKTISLTGPRGNTVTLDVQNPEHFKVVKMGDEVLVTYTEAVAVSVEPAAKKAPAKK